MDENIKDINNKILGSKIREYRKKNKLSLEELAKKIGITKLSVQKYEVGDRTIPFNILVNFFKELEIPINELEYFFKKEKKSEIKEILKDLSKEDKKLTDIVYFIEYLENLGFSFSVVDSFKLGHNLVYGDMRDALRNPKIVIIKHLSKNSSYSIGIRDFILFISFYSVNNLSSFINYFETLHLDRNDTIYNDMEIERMEEIFSKIPLKSDYNYNKILERLGVGEKCFKWENREPVSKKETKK